ncbi:MAG TPA: glycosyltransferase [Longimicrobium sp.]|nr:glycosyltransferase [Longimicrobium sp.]
MEPLVSIVIPVYNGADYLAQAIDSALAQTYPRVEVLVVDDGSSDGGATERIARAYGERVRYLAKANGGVATALNAGIEAMAGEYFSWLSHDDVYLPDKVQAQVEALRGLPPETVVCGPHQQIDARGRRLGDTSGLRVPDDAVLAVLSTALHGCTFLVPRRAFRAAGGFNPALPTTQDNDMWLRIALAGFPFHYLPRIGVQSRQHPEQGHRRVRSHAAERDRWFRWAVDAIGPEARARGAALIADVLLQKGHLGVYLHLLRRLREDGVPRGPLLALLGRRLPWLARERARHTLREVPGLLWIKRKLFPAQPHAA